MKPNIQAEISAVYSSLVAHAGLCPIYRMAGSILRDAAVNKGH